MSRTSASRPKKYSCAPSVNGRSPSQGDSGLTAEVLGSGRLINALAPPVLSLQLRHRPPKFRAERPAGQMIPLATGKNTRLLPNTGRRRRMDQHREIELPALGVGVPFRTLGSPVPFPAEVVVAQSAFGGRRNN